ncbi:hypothetical protein [Streptomyces sp. SID11385]|uniref:hypothetical protein n=1 Tax=Streptomyces sp. SID11385 TaxID=2706031 RepID=UPI0013CCD222|nr:hypothetical protein [Streptomyces sp. SID11385]NEA42730.1 hypothetical protein [Streptomyces sp. SID11385]
MTLPALAAEPERPAPGSAAHDLTHYFCCDPDRALCGAVVAGTPIVTATEVVALCVVCDDLAQAPCPLCLT